METNNNNRLPEENEYTDNNRSNTPDEQDNQKQNASHSDRNKKHSSAASIDAIISSATDNVRARRHSTDWSNTGTNVSYEGATAPGGGGSVGNGQASGQSAVEGHITTNSEYDAARVADTSKGEKHNGRDEDLDPEGENRSQERDII